MPFNPLEMAEKKASQSLDDLGIGGLGWVMVKKLASELYYDRHDRTNILTIVFSRD